MEGLKPGPTEVMAIEAQVFGTICQDHIKFTVVKIDADVDSDNTNTTHPYGPDANPEYLEDKIEQREGLPGRYVVVNSDDDNLNGVLDLDPADHPVQANPDVPGSIDENDLVAITIKAPEFEPVFPLYVHWTITFPSDKISIWQLPDKQGASLASGTEMPWALYPLAPSPRTLYIEGLQASAQLGDVPITVAIWIDPDGSFGPLGYQQIHSDTVRVTCITADLDVDSDNTNGLFPPERDPTEETQESSLPGKYLVVNSINEDDPSDWSDYYIDHERIDDFGDGYNLDGASGTPIEEQDDESFASHGFIPIVLEIPAPIDLSKARVSLAYYGSDPAAATPSDAPPNDPPNRRLITPQGGLGALRVWTKKANTRNKAGIGDATPGDYVSPGVWTENPSPPHWVWTEYPASAFGLSDDTRTVTLYVEAVKAGSYQPIWLLVDPDGAGGLLPMGFLHDVVVVTPAKVTFSETAPYSGFDATLNPPGVMVPLPAGGTNTVHVSVQGGAPVKFSTQAGNLVTVPTGPHAGDFDLQLTSINPGSTLLQAYIDTPWPTYIGDLRICVLPRKTVSVMFHKVTDSATPTAHTSSGDEARALQCLDRMNQIWNPQANICFEKAADPNPLFVDNDPPVAFDLGPVVQSKDHPVGSTKTDRELVTDAAALHPDPQIDIVSV